MNIDLKELVILFNNRKPKDPLNLEFIKTCAKNLKHRMHSEKEKKILKKIRKIIHREQRKVGFGMIDEDLEHKDYLQHNNESEHYEPQYEPRNDFQSEHYEPRNDFQSEHYEHQSITPAPSFSFDKESFGETIRHRVLHSGFGPYDTDTDNIRSKFGDSTGILVRHS